MTVAGARDLAWCRSAFADLTAPVSGLGGGSIPSSPTAVVRQDWSTGPIGPGPLAHLAGPHPCSGDVVARVVTESGLGRRVDTVGATVLAWDRIVRGGVERLRAAPRSVRALGAVRARWDLEEAMLWDVFTHLGEPGLAARRGVTAELFRGGGLHRVLREEVAAGRLLRW